jgi:hypothetical protein
MNKNVAVILNEAICEATDFGMKEGFLSPNPNDGSTLTFGTRKTFVADTQMKNQRRARRANEESGKSCSE